MRRSVSRRWYNVAEGLTQRLKNPKNPKVKKTTYLLGSVTQILKQAQDYACLTNA